MHSPEVREPRPLSLHHLPLPITFALWEVRAEWAGLGVAAVLSQSPANPVPEPASQLPVLLLVRFNWHSTMLSSHHVCMPMCACGRGSPAHVSFAKLSTAGWGADGGRPQPEGGGGGSWALHRCAQRHLHSCVARQGSAPRHSMQAPLEGVDQADWRYKGGYIKEPLFPAPRADLHLSPMFSCLTSLLPPAPTCLPAVTQNAFGELCALQKVDGCGLTPSQLMQCIRLATQKVGGQTAQLVCKGPLDSGSAATGHLSCCNAQAILSFTPPRSMPTLPHSHPTSTG